MVRKKSFEIKKVHKFRDGRLHVYKVSTSRNWMCRFYADGKYKVKSTLETNLSTAKQIAMDWYDELRFNQKQGIPIHEILFSEASEKFKTYQRSLVLRGERTERQAKDYEYRISMLSKFFNKISISKIDAKMLDEYIQSRTVLSNNPVKIRTIKIDLTALRLVLKYSILQGWIKTLPPFPQLRKEKTNPRPWFEHDEWKHLLKTSNERINSAADKNKKWKREQLHDFMIFAVHTGLRVQECLRVRYGDISIKNKQKGDKEIRFEVQGKTGLRRVRGTIGAVRAVERLKKRNEPKPNDLLFPHNHKDGLNALLKECGLKQDRHGRERNAKSFRSTFIMFGLLRGLKDRDIADNCGNTPDIIHKYYAKYINIDMIGDSFTDLPE